MIMNIVYNAQAFKSRLSKIKILVSPQTAGTARSKNEPTGHSLFFTIESRLSRDELSNPAKRGTGSIDLCNDHDNSINQPIDNK